MKTKTDLYTRIVLTIIAVALVGLLLKDINFVGKAHANELDLSGFKVEQTNNGGPLFIYENNKLKNPIKTNNGSLGTSASGKIDATDIPIYIITDRTGYITIR